MKSKLMFRMAFFSLFLLGTYFFAPGVANAQSPVVQDLRSTPTGTFVNVPTAILRLDSELSILKVTMGTMNPHLPEYQYETFKHSYYSRIRELLNNVKDTSGAQTAQAIGDATVALESNTFDVDMKKLLKIKQDAIALLK